MAEREAGATPGGVLTVTTIINLLGAPGAGKSTAAAGVFYHMKKKFVSVELVTEYAKDLIYAGNEHQLEDVASLFAEQHHRIARLVGKVEYIITDSPIYLCAFYAPKTYPKEFTPFVMAMAARYTNVNLYLRRAHPYAAEGRVHSEAESRQIDIDQIAFLQRNQIDFVEIMTGDTVCERIINAVSGELAERLDLHEHRSRMNF